MILIRIHLFINIHLNLMHEARVVTRACNSITLEVWFSTSVLCILDSHDGVRFQTLSVLMMSTILVQSLLIAGDVCTSLTYLKICVSFGEMSSQTSLCILTSCFLTMEFYNSLYILDTSPLSAIHFLRYFHQIYVLPIFGFSFYPLNSIFHRSEFLVYQKFN